MGSPLSSTPCHPLWLSAGLNILLCSILLSYSLHLLLLSPHLNSPPSYLATYACLLNGSTLHLTHHLPSSCPTTSHFGPLPSSSRTTSTSISSHTSTITLALHCYLLLFPLSSCPLASISTLSPHLPCCPAAPRPCLPPTTSPLASCLHPP